MVSGPQLLRVTHKEMISGKLMPAFRYDLRINPIWGVQCEKEKGLY
jgi:hypothetical protein